MKKALRKAFALSLLALISIPILCQGQAQNSDVIVVDGAAPAHDFIHFWEEMFGSGRAVLALRDSYRRDLRQVKEVTGLKYVRFHGIFHDEVGVYSENEQGQPEYNFSYVDQIYDGLLAAGVRPFVELSFMPKALAAKNMPHAFWYKPNVSPPKDWAKWDALIAELAKHLVARYGIDEVSQWYFEVWNEPNLSGFWEGGDQKAYFELYDLTSKTIKDVDPKLRVGGPSTAGAAWVPEFLAHVKQSGAQVDFVTTHTYGVQGGFLDENGKSDTKLDPSPDAMIADVRHVREQISSSAFPGLPLYFTEWSSSYTPRDSVHDSYISAPYILNKLKASQGLVQGMSYWTYTDLFEEPGPPTAPFQGGFGLLNPQGIRKPAYFAYKYLHALNGDSLATNDPQAMLSTKDGNVTAVIWDFEQPDQRVSNRSFYTKVISSHPAAPVHLHLTHLVANASYHVAVHRTGFHANDAYTAYIELGSPKELSEAQIRHFNDITRDLAETDKLVRSGADGTVNLTFPMNSNDVVLVKLLRSKKGK
jgi:xylan 1,4-beta-xylosidase